MQRISQCFEILIIHHHAVHLSEASDEYGTVGIKSQS